MSVPPVEETQGTVALSVFIGHRFSTDLFLSTSTCTLPWRGKQQSHQCYWWVRLLITSYFTYRIDIYHQGQGSHVHLSNNICSVRLKQGRVCDSATQKAVVDVVSASCWSNYQAL